MPKNSEVCIQAATVAMGGSINVMSSLSIVTKASLDTLSVAGDCGGCEPPPPCIDIIVVVDGSDSYNSKAMEAGTITEGGAYSGTMKALKKYFFSKIPGVLPGTNNTAMIQFSGNKQLEGDYKPGSEGKTSTPAVRHWKWEMEPTELDDKNVRTKTAGFEASGMMTHI